ncbi:MAG: hypothetical protein JNM21_06485 [Taibaiella sp.]|nr:hypothetical protein [Taibaiella sp.]
MNKTNQYKLLTFITRIGMFVYPVDQHNITSFILGYEYGKRQSSSFTEQIQQRLADQYRIFSSSDGWPGQIRRLAKKSNENWVTIFRWVSLEILADATNGGWDETMSGVLKARIFALIERIEPEDTRWLDKWWIEDWLALCPVKHPWFQKIWADKEWRIIKPINKKLLLADYSFSGIPKKLLQLKDLLNS